MSAEERFDLADDAAFERLLRDALDGAGRPAPFPVDVTGAVMDRVSAYGPVPARQVGPAELRFWGAAAAAFAVVLVAMALSSSPSLRDLVRTAGSAFGLVTELAARAGLAAAALLEALVQAGGAILVTVRTVVAPAAPLATALLSGAVAAVLGLTAMIAGRDLLARRAPKENA